MAARLFLGWQAPETRRWFVVGFLDWDGCKYRFGYTQGFRAAGKMGFGPLAAFPEVEETYEAESLFPFFENRLLKKSRPDFGAHMDELALSGAEFDEKILILARSGGRRVTDEYFIFAPPVRKDGRLEYVFFSNGLRHLPQIPEDELARVKETPVYMCKDFQNEFDPKALLLRSPSGYLLGWCPRYLCDDVLRILEETGEPNAVRVVVDGINPPPAPIQFRIRCRLTAPWPKAQEPMSGEQYQPLVKLVEA